jgi:hypothetical protein
MHFIYKCFNFLPLDSDLQPYNRVLITYITKPQKKLKTNGRTSRQSF